MRLFVAVAILMLTAPSCASDATSKAGTGETIATGPEITVAGDAAGPTTTIACHVVNGPPPPNVQIGDCGDFVVELQTLLNESGFIIPVDGVYDETTEQAVKAFQTDRDLTVDGIVGPKTWKALSEGGVGD